MRGRATVLGALGGLAGAAAVALAGAGPGPAAPARAARFQQVVGGLGGGPALDLSRCAAAFDPRLGPRCSPDGGPVPGGRFLCPYHGHAPPD